MAKKVIKVVRKLEATDKKYELMLVLQPELLESTVEKKLKEFDKFLTENGGTVDLKEIWGKQKLAYRIKKNDEGIYVVYNITFPTTSNKELNEHLRIDKDIIRFLQINIDDSYEYKVFEEEIVEKEESKKEDTSRRGNNTPTASHKAAEKPIKKEIKDKGIKADAGKLDDKLDKLLEGDDLNI